MLKKELQLCVGRKGKRVGALLLITSLLWGEGTFANPVIDRVSLGDIQAQQSANVTTIQQSSPQAIIEWRSFNIDANEITHFQQPQDGIALNRIDPNHGASEIYGNLSATGKIILINQSGIYFGPDSSVNVSSIIASTANIKDTDFINNNYALSQSSNYSGAIINDGTIIASQHGLVALLGSAIANNGTIQAELGTVVLASGSKFTINFAGNDLINFSVDDAVSTSGVDHKGQVINYGVDNTGMISASKILVNANTASQVLDHAINMDGVAVATTVVQQGGTIILTAEHGSIKTSGKLIASGKKVEQKGGEIKLLAQNILINPSTILDVSGDTGGGNIYIGGSLQGKGPLPNAQTVRVAPNATILADALRYGNGGQVVVWSDNNTVFHGFISAQGGQFEGNGGDVETSGHYLDISEAKVNLLAPQGKNGTWLLDPTDVTISSSTTNNETVSTNTYNPSTNTSNILYTDLLSNLATSDITVATTSSGTANGDIGIASGITDFTWNAATTLTLNATRNIYINSDITATNGGLALSAANGSQSITTGTIGSGTIGGAVSSLTANINVGKFILNSGQWFQATSGTLPSFNAYNNFQITSGTTYNSYFNAQFTRLQTTSGNGITDIFGLQGIATGPLSTSYILNNNINATVTSTWNSNAGFIRVGSSGTPFTGTFNGNNKVINGLVISRSTTVNSPNNNNLGLFGATSGATISNVGLINAQVSGFVYIGTLAGSATNTTINNVYSSNVTVQGGNSGQIYTGGLIGVLSGGSLSVAYTSGTVSGYRGVGGLFGELGGTSVTNVYSSASVAGTTSLMGGLTGTVYGNNTISKAYSTGKITGASALGGLVGGLTGGTTTVSNSYWDTATTGQSSAYGNTGITSTNVLGGCFGTTTCANGGSFDLTQSANFSTWNIAVAPATGFTWGIINGSSYPYLTAFYPNTPRAISGSGITGSVVAMAANGANIAAANSFINPSQAIASSGANGFYYFLQGNGTVADGAALLAYTSSGSSANAVTLAPTGGSITGLNLTANTVNVGHSSANTAALSNTTLATAKGSLSSGILYSINGNNLSLGTNAFSTTSNTTYTINGDMATTNKAITFNGPAVLSNNATVKSGSGAISFNAITDNGAGTTLSLQENLTSSTGTVIFNGNVSLAGLITFAQPYTVVLSGSTNTFTSPVTFNNTAGVTLGDNNDSFTFNGGLTSTASTTTLSGTLASTNSPINLGPLVLTANSNIMSGSGVVNIGSASGNPYSLSLQQDIAGSTGTITFNGNVTLDNLITYGQAYAVNLNGTTNTFTSPVIFNNTAGVTLGDNNDSFTFNGGLTSTVSTTILKGTIATSNDVINLGNINLTGNSTLVSGSAAINIGAVNGNGYTLTLQQDTVGSTGTITFNGNVTLGNLITYGQAYAVNLNGTTNTFTSPVAFNNTGGVSLGDSNDNFTFNGGLTSTASTTTLNGTLASTNSPINLGTLVLTANSNIMSGSGAVNIGSVSGSPYSLSLQQDTAGSTGTVTFNGNVTLGNLITYNRGYAVNLNGSTNTFTSPVTFNNTAGVSLGDSNDSFTFNGGLTSTASTTTLNGTLASTNSPINLGSLVLTVNSNIMSGSGAVNIGSVSGSAYSLSLQQDTAASTGTVTFSGNVTLGNLITYSRGYAVNLNGSTNTFTSPVTFNNTAGITLGDNNDSFTFNGGLTSTASTTTLSGTLASTNSPINLGSLVLTANSNIMSGSGVVNIGSVSGSPYSLSLQQDTAGSTGTVTFSGNVTLGNLITYGQAYAVKLNGAANTFTSPVTFNNTNGVTLGDNNDTFNFNAGLTSTAGTTNINGAVSTTNSPITLGATTINGTSSLTSGNAAIAFGALIGGGTLTVNSSTQQNITANINIGGLTFNNPISIGSPSISMTTTSTSADITLAGAVTIPSGNTLSLVSARNIYLNGNINTSGSANGSLNLTAGSLANVVTSGSFASPSSTGVTANIYVSNFNLIGGTWSQVNNPLPVFQAVNNFQINSGTMPSANAQFIRALSGTGSSGLPYLLNDIYGIQGIGSTINTLGYSYRLNSNIDVSGAATWNSNAGFIRIGSSGTPFTGIFNGNNNIINGLVISRNTTVNSPDNNNLGLFGATSGATISNVGLINPQVSGFIYIGTLVGSATNTTINNAYSSNVTVQGGNSGQVFTGGLIGVLSGSSLSVAYSSGTVSGDAGVGGLTGEVNNNSSVTNVYSSASVIGANNWIGGLIGTVYGNSTISNTYSTGKITGASSLGGLIGGTTGGGTTTVSNSYWDTATTGQSNAYGNTGITSTNVLGGCFGTTTCANGGSFDLTQSTNFSTWNIAAAPATGFTWGIINGSSYPYLTAFYPSTPRAISGNGITGSVVAMAANGVNIAAANSFINPSQAIASSGANGFYYFLQGNGTVADGAALLVYTSSGSSANAVTLAPTSEGSITGLNLVAGTLTIGDNNTNNISNAILNTAKGSLSTNIAYSIDEANPNFNLTLNTNMNFNTSMNTTYILDGTINTVSAGSLTFNGPVKLNTDSSLFGQAIIFNAPVDALSAGSQSLYLQGGVTFASGAYVGLTNALSELTIEGSAQLNAGIASNEGQATIITTGNQLYTDFVTLGANAKLMGFNICFLSTIDNLSYGANNLTVNSSSIAQFNGTIGGNGALNNFIVTGENISLQGVQTTNNQTYTGTAVRSGITLAGNYVTNGGDFSVISANTTLAFDTNINTLTGNITFSGNIDSIDQAEGLALTTTGDVTLNGAIGSYFVLTNLNIPSGRIFFNSGEWPTVITSGSQIYGGDILLGGQTFLYMLPVSVWDGLPYGHIGLGKIDGPYDFYVVAPDVHLYNKIGSSSSINSLNIVTQSTISAEAYHNGTTNDISTLFDQAYNAPINAFSNLNFYSQSGSITLRSGVITTSPSLGYTFVAPNGTINAYDYNGFQADNMTFTAPTINLSGSVSTARYQNYNGNLVIPYDASLNSNGSISLNSITGSSLTINSDSITINGDLYLNSLSIGGIGNTNKLVLNTGSTPQNFYITSNDAGNIDVPDVDTFNFNNIQNLTGGNNDDSFIFSDGAILNGAINGGTGDNNILDLSDYTTNTNIVVNSSGLYGLNGSAPQIAGGFTNISIIVGKTTITAPTPSDITPIALAVKPIATKIIIQSTSNETPLAIVIYKPTNYPLLTADINNIVANQTKLDIKKKEDTLKKIKKSCNKG